MGNTERTTALHKSRRFEIDMGIRVLLYLQGADRPVPATFVGMLKENFIILSLPEAVEQMSLPDSISPGSTIKVKYLYEGAVYAFKTKITGVIRRPIRVLALLYPRMVQKQALRGMKRNEVVIPARIRLLDQDMNVVVSDINKTGCNFKCQEFNGKIPENTAFRFYCHFPGTPKETSTRAVVRNVRWREKNISLGSEFIEPDDRFQQSLTEFLVAIANFS